MFLRSTTELVLASGSVSRAGMLRAAGLEFVIEPAAVDEPAVRAALERGGETLPADVAEVLARAKAEEVSARRPAALVIGADQVLAADGDIFRKPATMDEARSTLLALQGATHQLHTAVSVARAGAAHWTHAETVHMTMRELTPEFVGRYLAETGETALQSVGAYQLEGLGVHLFEKVEGDYFTVLGLPLLPLLAFLRGEGVLA